MKIIQNYIKNYALFHSKHPDYSTRSAIYKYHIFDPVYDKIYYDQPNLMKTLHSTRYPAAAFLEQTPSSLKEI